MMTVSLNCQQLSHVKQHLNMFFLTEFVVGFQITSISGMEGDMIEVCIRSYEGVLGPDIVLDYLISAPREEDALPDQIDTAICN